MGAHQSQAQVGLGAHSTAKQVVDNFGEGKYLAGKTAIVTGGNSGIGLETCKALAYAGCRVILCSRSVSAAEKEVASEIAKPGHGGYVVDTANIVIKQLDLNSLKSVKTFADDFVKSENRLDFLVLNAGIMALPNKEYTDAGFERQIGVNHFGHFYLTSLLTDQLKNTPDGAGRVVVLSSVAHDMGSVDVNDLHYKNGRSYRAWEAYGQSKLANLLFAKGFADVHKGSNLTALSVHPGVIRTNLWNASLFNRIAGSLVSQKSIPQGAATTVYACVCPGMGTEGNRGAYLEDCRISCPKTAQGRDPDLTHSRALWKVTQEQINEAVKTLK